MARSEVSDGLGAQSFSLNLNVSDGIDAEALQARVQEVADSLRQDFEKDVLESRPGASIRCAPASADPLSPAAVSQQRDQRDARTAMRLKVFMDMGMTEQEARAALDKLTAASAD